MEKASKRRKHSLPSTRRRSPARPPISAACRCPTASRAHNRHARREAAGGLGAPAGSSWPTAAAIAGTSGLMGIRARGGRGDSRRRVRRGTRRHGSGYVPLRRVDGCCPRFDGFTISPAIRNNLHGRLALLDSRHWTCSRLRRSREPNRSSCWGNPPDSTARYSTLDPSSRRGPPGNTVPHSGRRPRRSNRWRPCMFPI